ncbi:MAG: tRNA 2-selenouridine(34) synthase MnmH [Rhodobacteraceae bacterium]|nr:tRNA 2-selenouridine(34) synthase MnmH [Paracoccaceae bacterium]
MPLILSSLTELSALAFDDIIDVRSPAEYAEDHIPGAISLPALDNDQRAQIGTIYTQESPFRARRLGAALVARNVAHYLETTLADRPKGWRPLVYCWRGGQRSGSVAMILRQIGWQAETIDGGWRSYRRLVKTTLYEDLWPTPVVVLDGDTGTAKTDLLALLAEAGVQVLDLEGMANHRGSLFGAMPGGQPAQKGFETELAFARMGLDPARVVVVEAESSKIGHINLPPGLWRAMKSAPRLVLAAPLAARAEYLARRYADVTSDPARLLATIEGLAPQHPRAQIDAWREMAQARAYEELAATLMADHYDPRYGRQRDRFDDRPCAQLDLTALDPATLQAAVPGIVAAIGKLSAG